jgi:hypothetical protein
VNIIVKRANCNNLSNAVINNSTSENRDNIENMDVNINNIAVLLKLLPSFRISNPISGEIVANIPVAAIKEGDKAEILSSPSMADI